MRKVSEPMQTRSNRFGELSLDNHRKGLRFEGGARWSGVGWGWGLTLDKGAEFRGQSSWRELVLALLLGTDDFPGGAGMG